MSFSPSRILIFVAALLGLMWLLNPYPVRGQTDDEAWDPITIVDATGQSITITDTSRIITIGGAITEIVFDLGMGDHIIAVDESSIYPEAATRLPQIGYLRFLSAEPIVARGPSLVITTEDAGPPETLAQLQGAGVTVVVAPAEDTLTGTEEKIRTVAAALDRVDEGERIIQDMQQRIETAQTLTTSLEGTPRVLIMFAGSSVVLGVLGQDSGGNEMLRLAGAENAITINDNYIPLTSEAIVAAAPDVILTTTLSIERVGGFEAFLDLPGVSLTPAAQNGRIVYQGMDDLYLLGFTPRLGDAILDLTYLLHNELPRSVDVVVRLQPELSQFERILQTASTAMDMPENSTFTVLAPTDAALAEIGDASLDVLLHDPAAAAEFVAHHLLQGGHVLTDLPGQVSLSGQVTITTETQDGVTRIDDVADITLPDLAASNGVVHLIDAVLEPPE